MPNIAQASVNALLIFLESNGKTRLGGRYKYYELEHVKPLQIRANSVQSVQISCIKSVFI